MLLSDTGTYASSNFTGSKIFGFKTGSGSINDAELGFALSYSSGSDRSDIQFSNFLYEDTYTDGSNNITGYKYYKQFTHPETIAENIDYEVNVNPSLSNEKVNKYDNQIINVLILEEILCTISVELDGLWREK